MGVNYGKWVTETGKPADIWRDYLTKTLHGATTQITIIHIQITEKTLNHTTNHLYFPESDLIHSGLCIGFL
jgi:hypothetical protein